MSKYLTLAEEGLVPKMNCPMDQGLLMPNQDIEDNVYLYCLSCYYKKHIGTDMYEEMKRAVNGEHV